MGEIKWWKKLENVSPKKEVTIESLRHKRYYVKNAEYLEMHPEQRDATFVEALAGTDIEEFARDLLLLKKNTEDKIVGVFNGTPLDVSKYDTAAEIQDLYNGEIQRAREDKSIKGKGEFLEESWYHYQFYKVSQDENARSEIEEYNRNSNQSISEKELAFSSIYEPKDGVDMRDFFSALKYKDSLEDSFGGKNYIKVHGMLLCTSEFSSVDELAKKVEELGSSVTIIKDGKCVDTRRLIALMQLGIKCGDTISVRVEGVNEDKNAQLLLEFLKENNF